MEIPGIPVDQRLLDILKVAGAPKEMIEHFQKHLDYDGVDPSKYPASVLVENGELLMLMSQIDHQAEKVAKAQRDLGILMREAEILRDKWFIKAEETYPEITVPDDPQYGFRVFEGKVYFVSWPNLKCEHGAFMTTFRPSKEEEDEK